MSTNNFPVLYGRRITNSHDLIRANLAIIEALQAGEISYKEANALNREGRKILKMFQSVVREMRHRARGAVS